MFDVFEFDQDVQEFLILHQKLWNDETNSHEIIYGLYASKNLLTMFSPLKISVYRNIPQGFASMKEGKWERSKV